MRRARIASAREAIATSNVAMASKAATSSTLSAYVRRGAQLAKAWVEEE
jgi:hypothetical protein